MSRLHSRSPKNVNVMASSTSFCWWCGKKLTQFKSRTNNGVAVIDPIGNSHIVHKCCEKDAKGQSMNPANATAYHGDIDGDFDY